MTNVQKPAMTQPLTDQQQREFLLKQSSWYHALTLHERAFHNTSSEEITPSLLSDDEHVIAAIRRFQQWKEQTAFQADASFARRLSLDHLSEPELLCLLQEPIESLQARTETIPEWLVLFVHAFEGMLQVTLVENDALPSGKKSNVAHKQTLGFLTAVAPLLAEGIKRLRLGIEEITHKYEAGATTSLPYNPTTILGILSKNLPAQVASKLDKTMVLEMNVARVRGELDGEMPQERFASFIQRLKRPAVLLALFQEYPVLARQLVQAIDHWISYSLEFLEHLCSSWTAISMTILRDKEPGVLTEVSMGQGDTHRGGRSVIKLKFNSGERLIYKPRSLAIEVHFQDLLAWLNKKGYSPQFSLLTLLDKGSYGWSEFVVTHACTTEAEIKRFYERQGAYLALLYVLEATDFHHENLLAAGEYPVLIDLEALFHPHVKGKILPSSAYLTAQEVASSVLRTALLPQQNQFGVDISGIGGQGGLSSKLFPAWENVGTDEMHLGERQGQIEAAQNQPTLQGVRIEVLHYRAQILTGFERMYRLLLEHRSALLEQLPLWFAQDEIRFIARPTNLYTRLFTESFHPDLLRDALDRDRFFDQLWLVMQQQPTYAPLIQAEIRDLLDGDIPFFSTSTTSCDLYNSRGEVICANFFDTSGLACVQQRLALLDEKDLQRQLWFVEASLATISTETERAQPRLYQQRASSSNMVTSDDLLASACAIGDRLSELAVRGEDDISWIGISMTAQQQWTLIPAGTDLYSGVAGITLFFAYLAAATNIVHYEKVARSGLNTIRKAIIALKAQKKPAINASAFNGLAGTIYLLSHLGSLWQDASLLTEADDLLALFPAWIENDEHFDLIAGSAGTLLCVLSLKQAYPSSRLARAIATLCGDHLLRYASPMQQGLTWKSKLETTQPLAGFSHGAAGIGYSLLALSQAYTIPRFHPIALSAFAYERSVFSIEKHNWPDFRVLNHVSSHTNPQEVSFMTAWCHGAPGIALSRLKAWQWEHDETFHEEAEIAIATMINEGFGFNHSLCHGDLGNLDILVTASQILPNSGYDVVIKRLTAMVLESIATSGWVTGLPLAVESPGLMSGLAGIGYGLLRLADPTRIPSILSLEPPISKP